MIGYIEKAVDYFSDTRPKKAQSVPASLFYRSEGMGLFHETSTKTVAEMLTSGKRKLQHLPFNLFISEKHKLEFEVSEHPVQDGSTIADHVHGKLREVSIEGLFTNHPIRQLRDTNEVKFKDEYATSEVRASVTNQALVNFEKLKRLAQLREPVRLVCSLEIYPKMIITSIDYERDSKSGSSIRFTMTLKEIKVVTLNKTTIAYNFQPDEMKTANDRMIAEEMKTGKRNAEVVQANQLSQMLNTEVVR